MTRLFLVIALCVASSALAAPYAVVDANGNVQNLIEWDGVSPYQPGPGLTVKPVTPALATAFSAKTTPPAVVVPPPTVITSSAFQARFTATEQAAIWAAAAKDTTGQIGAGLTRGLANGSIDLLDPALQTWLNVVVAAGALSADRVSALTQPR